MFADCLPAADRFSVHAKRPSSDVQVVPVEIINRFLNLLGAHMPVAPPIDAEDSQSTFQAVPTTATTQHEHLNAVSVDWQDAGMVWDDAFADAEELLSVFGLNAVDWGDHIPWLNGS